MWKAMKFYEDLKEVKYSAASSSSKVWLQGRKPVLNNQQTDTDLGYQHAEISLPSVSGTVNTKVIKLYDNARAIRVYSKVDMQNQEQAQLPAIVFEIRPPHELERNYTQALPAENAPQPFRFDSACNLANDIFALHNNGFFSNGKVEIIGLFGENGTFHNSVESHVCMCTEKSESDG